MKNKLGKVSKRRQEKTEERELQQNRGSEDGKNTLGKVSNRRWEKTEEWELWQKR